MTRHRLRLAPAAVLWISFAASAGAQEAHHESAVLGLSPPLRAALIEEMQQVDANMQRIIAGLPRADWPALLEASRNIRGSFILARKLSAEQRAELHRALPEHFLALDARFHHTADRLASAAREGDRELAVFYIYKLAESCVSCHAQYALHRFPAFEPEKPTGH
jgi:hypothetical protein